MNTNFCLDTRKYSIRRLYIENIAEIQKIFEKCNDYILFVEGHAVEENTGEQEFLSLPKGKSQTEKEVFGIFNELDILIGYLDTLRDYPGKNTWWIGLLIFIPEERSMGIGQKVVSFFIDYAKEKGAIELKLGVLEGNEKAFNFWVKLGFKLVDTLQSDYNVHKINVMCLRLNNNIITGCVN